LDRGVAPPPIDEGARSETRAKRRIARIASQLPLAWADPADLVAF
jgi:hypothetical protein